MGWLTGLILGVAVSSTAKHSGAESITAPKPLRLLVVLMIVILSGMGYAITTTTSSSTQVAETVAPDTTGIPLETVEVVITDQKITMSNSVLKTSFAMKVENRSSKTCELDFDTPSGGSYSYTYDKNPVIQKGQIETINIKFNSFSTETLQLNCEADTFSPDYLDLQGPIFTLRN